MKASELIQGEIYTDLTYREIPLMFNGIISNIENHGWNTYGYYAEFTPVKTERNKNWFDIGIQTKFFHEESGNTTITKTN
jgi:hypothetical protein